VSLSILKNSTYLIASQVLVKAVGFFYNLFLAGTLGVENFGLYGVALSYFSIISIFSDFGISQYLIREVAVDNSNSKKILSNVIFLRVCIASILFGSTALILSYTDSSNLRLSLSLLAIFAVLPQTVALSIDSIFVAVQKLKLSSIGVVFLSIITTVLGIFMVTSGFGVIGVLYALILGEFAYLALNFLILKKLGIGLNLFVDSKTIKEVVIKSLPYGLLMVLGLLYFKIDTLLLSYLKGSYQTGIYVLAYKFLEVVIFIPAAFNASFFPFMSRLASTNPERIFSSYLSATKILFLISLVILGFYLLILPFLITSLAQFFPSLAEFIPAIDAIRILSLTIPFLFMIQPQSIVFLSSQKLLKPLILFSLFNLLFNIALNFLLIPRFGYMGSAWATVVSDVTGFLIFFIYIYLHFRKVPSHEH
jgi:O-antigen/teichoic acid export membrane protein